MARIHKNGAIDSTFIPDLPFELYLYEMNLQDNKVFIGGTERDSMGFSHGYLSRLNNDGSIDSTFQEVSLADHIIYTIETTKEAQILCGGTLSGHGNNDLNPLFRMVVKVN